MTGLLIGEHYLAGQVYYDSAFYYLENSLKLAEENQLGYEKARGLFDMGMLNNKIQNYQTSITYYLKSVDASEEIELMGPVGSAYNNIGANYFLLEQYEKAIEYYEIAKQMAEEDGDMYSVGIDCMNIGEAYYELNQLDKAKTELEGSLRILDSIGFNPPTVHLYYARTMKALGEDGIAKTEAKEALELAQKDDNLILISEAAELLYHISAEEKNFKEAIGYNEIHTRFKDSLNTAREMNEIEKLKLNFELAQKKEELAYLSQKNRYQNIIYLLIGAGVLLLLVLVSRQFKIVKMTREIHSVQKRLIGQELDSRNWKKQNPEATAFEASLQQDLEI